MRNVALLAGIFATATAACALGRADPAPPSVESTREALTRPDGQIESWKDISSPQARGFHALAYDEARQELIVFGGAWEGGVSTGTWAWNGTWEQRKPALAPPPRTAPMMAYDSDRKRVVLFGGQTNFGPSDETWSWDGNNWKLETPATKPSARQSGTMAYDPVRKTVVLFSGSTGQDETWTYDGITWKREAPTAKPPFNRQIAMVFDKARQSIVVAAQSAGAGCPVELWKWNGSTWSPWSFTGPVPTVCGFAAAYDATQNAIVLVGYSPAGPSFVYRSWSFDGASWTDVTPAAPPPPRQGHAMVFDTKRGELLSFGGYRLNGYGATRELRRRSGTTWTADPSSAPPQRSLSSAARGPNGTIVSFGGVPASNLPSNETFTFDGKGWTQKAPVTSPSPRYLSQMAFDERRNQTVLLSGRDNSQLFVDTWTWDGAEWTKKTPAHQPPFTEGTLVYDAVRERVWLIETSVNPVRTWSWDGQDWTLVNLGPAPPFRYGAGVAFDRVRGVTVVFGGQTDSGVTDDTWTWDGTTWAALTPQDRPAPRMGGALAWDEARKQLVLFGGQGPTGYLNDVWRWDGQNWSPLVDPNASDLPAERDRMMFLPIGDTGNMLLFGGYGSSVTFDDQWLFRTRGGTCKNASECGSGACIDGACCESSTCGTCETCAGVDRGLCEPVRNAEDPDTCATKSGKRCNADGRCLGGAGATCKVASDCSTGFCVDGFCCGTSCDLPCEACSAATKQIASDDGRCGPAKAGSNPGNRCNGTDTCNAAGVCEARTEAKCKSASLLDLGDGTSQDCSPYVCKQGACTKTCSSYADCTFPASCSVEGRCEVKRDVADDSGCGMSAPQDATAPSAATILAFACVLGTRKRARRPSENR